jgi:tetratricopeptide (TPR) repeat protein
LRGLLLFAIVAAVLAVFWPALANGFVDWDDPSVILNNQNFRGLGSAQLGWMFSTFYWGHYQPLVWLSYALDYVRSVAWSGDGLQPRAYHLTSLLLHAANAVLVYLLARRLLGAASSRAPPPLATSAAAAVVALLWAVHPLRVEPVAWVTGRGDVLCTFFVLLAGLAFLKAASPAGPGRRAAWIVLAVIAYGCSLLSRAMGTTLPVILILLDVYPLRRLGGGRGRWFRRAARGVWLEKLPFFLLAGSAAVLAFFAKSASGSTVAIEHFGLAQRAVLASYGLVFYVHKTLLPLALSNIYELIRPMNIWLVHYVLPAGALLAAVLALVLLCRRRPGIRMSALCYAILVAPVLGFVQAGNQEAADRYAYLPSIPLMLVAGGALLWTWRTIGMHRAGNTALVMLATAAIASCAALARQQCHVWQSTATLWDHAAATDPGSSIALNGKGFVQLEQHQYDEAIPLFRRAIAIQPANEQAHHNLWKALADQGRTDGLLAAYHDSIRVYPNFVDAHYNLGAFLGRRGDTEGALSEYTAALRLRPDHSKAHTNLGLILAGRGDLAAAEDHYQAALRSDPQNVAARHGLALLREEQGRLPEAVAELRAAQRIDPSYAPVQKTLKRLTGESTGGP